MSDPLDYTPQQTVDFAWVFALDVEPGDLGPWSPPEAQLTNGAAKSWPLPDHLGVATLDPAHVEVFEADEIREFGLARYLTDAHGYDAESVAPDAARLDALTGPLVLLSSRALPNTTLRLNPKAPLTFIGRYQRAPDIVAAAPIETESAQGQLAPQPSTPARMPIWPIFLFIFIVLALIVVLVLPKL